MTRTSRPRSPLAAFAIAAVVFLNACSERGASARADDHGHEQQVHADPAAAPQSTAGALLCDEHRVPESECGICHPELVSTLTPGHGLKIRFASAESAAKAGVQTAAPEVGSISDGVECYAEIFFNQNKLAHVAAPVNGIIHAVEVDLGERVEEGARLATIWS